MSPCSLYLLIVFLPWIFNEKQREIGSNVFKNEQNIGTVIFEKSNFGNHCWTSEELTILNSRRMFQDLMPKASVVNCQSDKSIEMLMDYLHLCLESVRNLSVGKTKHLILKALADTIGGYLQVYILPLTKHSYYAGNITYGTAKKLFDLFDQFNNFLRSNGAGWRKPTAQINHINTSPIVIEPPTNSLACSGFITYPASSDASKSRTPITIPLPFLDNGADPNSIALPFKTENLHSLYSEKSAFVLVKYYIAGVKCITSKSGSKAEIKNFKTRFYNWLQRSIHPHLNDKKWYPAFGGVLRVLNSLKEAGVESSKEKFGEEYQIMPLASEEITKPTKDFTKAIDRGEDILSFGTNKLIVIGVASALLVWLLLGLTLICYKCLKKNSDQSPRLSPSDTPIAILFQSEHCKTQCPSCPSGSSDKEVGNKLKLWWNKKLNKKNSEYNHKYEDEERCLDAMNYSSNNSVNSKNNKQFQ